MSAKQLPWFRLYTEIIDDEKLGLLAFEDRWHFISILCLKGKGLLDSEPDHEMLMRKVAFKMGLTCGELENVALRLSRMGLIDRDTLQPTAWDARQMQSDSSAERVKAFRDRKQAERYSNVTVTAQELDTDTDTEEDKYKDKRLSPTAPDAPSKKSKPKLNSEDLPAELKKNFSPEVMQAFIDHRNVIKKSLTLHALELNLLEAVKSRDQGVTPTADAAVDETILAGWVGVNSGHLKNRLENNRGQKNETSSKSRKPSLCERATLARKETERRLSEREAYGEFVGEAGAHLRPQMVVGNGRGGGNG